MKKVFYSLLVLVFSFAVFSCNMKKNEEFAGQDEDNTPEYEVVYNFDLTDDCQIARGSSKSSVPSYSSLFNNEDEKGEFVGWITDKAATSPAYKAGGAFKASGDLKLYPLFRYKVNYHYGTENNGVVYSYNTQTVPIKKYRDVFGQGVVGQMFRDWSVEENTVDVREEYAVGNSSPAFDIDLYAVFEPCLDHFFYDYSESLKGYVITGLDESKLTAADKPYALSLPEVYDDGHHDELPVKGIAPYAFKNNADVVSVVIPECITEIGAFAFADSGLKSVIIPATITTSGADVFKNCSELESVKVTLDPNAETGILENIKVCNGIELTIPEGVEVIESFAFKDYTGLKSVVIPASVRRMETSVFKGCVNLETVSITSPSSLEEIGYSAFENCRKLEAISLPASVTELGDSVFSYSGLKSMVIPANITSLAGSMFEWCANLETVDLNKVTHIGPSAFKECAKLSSITFKNCIEVIEESSFKGCTGLTSIEIPSSVGKVGEYAFDRCDNVTAIKVSVPKYEGLGGNQNVNSKYESWHENVLNNLKDYDGLELTIENGTLAIEDSAFKNCSGLVSVKIPEGVKSIGASAFAGCTKLDEITIPASVNKIGDDVFYGCSLDAVNVTYTGKCDDWDKIRTYSNVEVTIPGSIEVIGEDSGAFKNWAGLKSVIKEAGPTGYVTKRQILEGTFRGCENLESVTLTDITEIYPYAFAGCCNLKSVVIPASCYSVCDYAFDDCEKMQTVTLPAKNCVLGKGVFNNCVSLESVKLPELEFEFIESYGYGKPEVSESLFDGCISLKSVEIPVGYCEIRSYAFRNCSELSSLVLPESATFPTENVEGVFAGSGLVSIDLPSKMYTIAKDMFKGCRNLKSIDIPGNVNFIGASAFEGCSALTDITIRDNVYTVEDAAFKDCGIDNEVTVNLVGMNEEKFMELVCTGKSCFEGTKYTFNCI